MTTRKTGINSRLYKPYNYKKEFGTKVQQSDEISFAIFKFLAEQTYIVEKTSRYGLVNTQNDNMRYEFASALSFQVALEKLFLNKQISQFVHGQQPTISEQNIKDFISWELSPRIKNSMCLPFVSDKVVKFRNNYVLNEYTNDSLTYSPDKVDNELLREGLNLYACSLTNATQPLPDNLFTTPTEVWKGTEFYPFLYIIHWFAAIYQNPGIKHHTTLALIGPVEGCGKGSFMKFIQHIIGETAVGELNENQVDPNKFNSEIIGKQILILNEQDTQDPKILSAFVKKYGTDETVQIRTKFLNDSVIINIGNIVITGNLKEILNGFSNASRRLSYVSTFDPVKHDSLTTKQVQDKVRDFVNENERNDPEQKFVHSLCKLFSEIKCDLKTINLALETEEKEYVGSNKLSITERFVLSNTHFFYEIGAGKQCSFKKLHKQFCIWQTKYNYKPMDPAMFAAEMTNMRIKHTDWFAPKGNEGLIVLQGLVDKHIIDEEDQVPDSTLELSFNDKESNVVDITQRERTNKLKALNSYGENTND
ncbi:primase-helicase family protein [Gluconobacter potus]|uniref:primase-helicase family protein n=1 Tax=Gluconobacter potus TaxID=2724927 RepID=UPI000A3FE482|nr:primase-helicase family protein [Gluconobacter potus]